MDSISKIEVCTCAGIPVKATVDGVDIALLGRLGTFNTELRVTKQIQSLT